MENFSNFFIVHSLNIKHYFFIWIQKYLLKIGIEREVQKYKQLKSKIAKIEFQSNQIEKNQKRKKLNFFFFFPLFQIILFFLSWNNMFFYFFLFYLNRRIFLQIEQKYIWKFLWREFFSNSRWSTNILRKIIDLKTIYLLSLKPKYFILFDLILFEDYFFFDSPYLRKKGCGKRIFLERRKNKKKDSFFFFEDSYQVAFDKPITSPLWERSRRRILEIPSLLYIAFPRLEITHLFLILFFV